MILHIVKCEQCSNQFEFSPLEHPAHRAAPEGWHTLYETKDMNAQEGWYFCSLACLFNWTAGRRHDEARGAAVSTVKTYTDKWGHGALIFTDRETPPGTGKLEETSRFCFEQGKDEHVLHLTIGDELLKLAQSDIRQLLPYLERFVQRGKLIEEQP